jgi:hypothetical protein
MPVSHPLRINKNTEFFIAVAKKSIHSFVMLGVIENKQPLLLARVGKTNAIDKDADSRCKLTLKQIVSQAEAQLQSEPLHLDGHLSYAAYTITYAQYLRFIKLAGLATRVQDLYCYLPESEDEEKINFKLKVIPRSRATEKPTEPEKTLIQKTHYLSLANTCRNTAIDLIEYTQGLTSRISRNFFRELPSRIHFKDGQTQQPFYVFPLPPGAYDVDKRKKLFLTRIYKRMETLLEKDPYGDNTMAKFSALKSLYQSQADLLSHLSLEAALDNIQLWRKTNARTIDTLRAQSFLGKWFTRQSSTARLATSLEKELTQAVSKNKR